MVSSKKHISHEEAANDRVMFGFWLYLMTDLLMFAVLFAVFAVLRNNTNGGPAGSELFKLPPVLASTFILLTSSLTIGLGMLAAQAKNIKMTQRYFGVTFLLGLAFLGLEGYELTELIHEGHTFSSSAFLSSFFALVGSHGIHIVFGLLWLGSSMYYINKRGLSESIMRKVNLLSLYWHFLDIVWIFIFTIVYLMAFV